MQALYLFAFLFSARVAVSHAESAFSPPQKILAGSQSIENRTSSTGRNGNLIFQSVSGLLQHWPNTKYANGHTVALASIAPGTTLYHVGPPFNLSKPEWLATDPEHSYIFCAGDCHLLSFVTTRKLRLAYFDGSSVSNMKVGTMDSQDIIFWGEIRPEMTFKEWERAADACEWGKQFKLDGFDGDGFVRKQNSTGPLALISHLCSEVVMCQFLEGLKLVSNSSIMAYQREQPSPSVFDPFIIRRNGSPEGPGMAPGRHIPEPVIPPGWKGSIRKGSSVEFESMHAGAWHNHSPGETRVHIDYSRLVSFFDPALTSLSAVRANTTRYRYRISGISLEDIVNVRQQMVDIFSREEGGSGIDWGSIVHVVIERYSARLDLVRHLLEPFGTRNVTEQARQVRAQVLTMLTPYMLVSAIPSNETTPERSWITPIVDHCATALTSWTPTDTLTRQELVVKNAIEDVLHEICGVLGDIWVDAFDIEVAHPQVIQPLFKKWSTEIESLMNWLDWSVWDKCNPECGPEQICYIPTWPWGRRWGETEDDPEVDMTPRCVSRLEPHADFNVL